MDQWSGHSRPWTSGAPPAGTSAPEIHRSWGLWWKEVDRAWGTTVWVHGGPPRCGSGGRYRVGALSAAMTRGAATGRRFQDSPRRFSSHPLWTARSRCVNGTFRWRFGLHSVNGARAVIRRLVGTALARELARESGTRPRTGKRPRRPFHRWFARPWMAAQASSTSSKVGASVGRSPEVIIRS